jgi:hypothetical protein
MALAVSAERRGLRSGPGGTLERDAVPSTDTGLGARLEAASAVLAAVVSELDPGCLTGGDATVLYESFAGFERLAMAGKTLLAPRIEASGVWRDTGHRNAAAMLASLEGVSPGQAKNTLTNGHRLDQLPGTEDAVRSGTISAPKLNELIGAGVLDPAREPELLKGAAEEPLQLVRERCHRSRATSRSVDPLATLREIRASRHFSSWTDPEGAFCYQGRDTADRGAQILNHLNHGATRLRQVRRAAGDENNVPESTVRADAFFFLMTQRQIGSASEPDSEVDPGRQAGRQRAHEASAPGQSSPGPSAHGPPARGPSAHGLSAAGRQSQGHPQSGASLAKGVPRNWADPPGLFDPDLDPDFDPDLYGTDIDSHLDIDTDCDADPDTVADPDTDDSLALGSGGDVGLGGSFERGLNGGPSSDSLSIIDRPPTCSTVVRVDLSALLRGHAIDGEICEIDSQGPIPVAMARDMANDSFLRLVFHRAGDIRAVSHLGRTINRTLRTALVHRDRTCVVPGCAVTFGLEIDHVIPVAEQGPTELDNLALLCHHHHSLKTYEGWTLSRIVTVDDGTPKWRFEPQPAFGQEPLLGIDSPEARAQWDLEQHKGLPD